MIDIPVYITNKIRLNLHETWWMFRYGGRYKAPDEVRNKVLLKNLADMRQELDNWQYFGINTISKGTLQWIYKEKRRLDYYEKKLTNKMR